MISSSVDKYIYINIDRRGTKTILGPAGALRVHAGKRVGTEKK